MKDILSKKKKLCSNMFRGVFMTWGHWGGHSQVKDKREADTSSPGKAS